MRNRLNGIPGKRARVALISGAAALAFAVSPNARALSGYDLGGGLNYGLIFQGGGGNALNINAGPALVSGMAVNGNVGIAGTGTFNPSGGSVVLVSGNVDFAGTANSFSSSYVAGSVNSPVPAVQTTMNSLNQLSHDLWFNGGASVFGTAINLGNGTTIDASTAGVAVDALGDKVFNATMTSDLSGGTGIITVNGDGTHKVVINISTVNNFHANKVILTGGLTPDDVLWNFYGGDAGSLTGGPTMNINSGGGSPSHTDYVIQGVFLDPFGDINISDSQIDGRVFGGDSHNAQWVSGAYLQAPSSGVPDGGSSLLLLSMGLGFTGAAWKKLRA